jgi:signal transduction histidine kinase
MINACVSHEMRNPLNSIMAQNLEKDHLYQELGEAISQFKQNIDTECLTETQKEFFAKC